MFKHIPPLNGSVQLDRFTFKELLQRLVTKNTSYLLDVEFFRMLGYIVGDRSCVQKLQSTEGPSKTTTGQHWDLNCSIFRRAPCVCRATFKIL